MDIGGRGWKDRKGELLSYTLKSPESFSNFSDLDGERIAELYNAEDGQRRTCENAHCFRIEKLSLWTPAHFPPKCAKDVTDKESPSSHLFCRENLWPETPIGVALEAVRRDGNSDWMSWSSEVPAHFASFRKKGPQMLIAHNFPEIRYWTAENRGSLLGNLMVRPNTPPSCCRLGCFRKLFWLIQIAWHEFSPRTSYGYYGMCPEWVLPKAMPTRMPTIGLLIIIIPRMTINLGENHFVCTYPSRAIYLHFFLFIVLLNHVIVSIHTYLVEIHVWIHVQKQLWSTMVKSY